MSHEVIYTGKKIELQVHRYESGGHQVEKEVVVHPGAVTLLPVLDDGRIVMIHCYRYAVDRWLTELPAGTLEPPESPVDTAFRELAEETGYRARRMEPLCEYFVNPGVLTERMYVYVARGLSEGEQALEADEKIQTRIVSADEAQEMIRSGDIEDAKTIVSLLCYLHGYNPKA